MKVGLVSPYLETMGGGERYILTVAEYFLNRNDTVDIFSKEEITSSEIKARFDLDLAKAKFINVWRRIVMTAGYGLMFFVSDGSIPASLARKNILHFQVPFNYKNQKTIANKIKFSRFSHVICNSKFTKIFVDQTYGINSEVIYPPVDVEKFKPGKKENIVLSVGRFFAPLQAKKQEIMIEVFKRMKIPGWRMVLIGGVGKERMGDVRRFVKETAIEVIVDAGFDTLRDYYSRSKIYWHAAGFGEDLEENPGRAEHFGISTVEAMAAGCVPIVFAGGGQREIVDEGRNGFLWKNTGELIAKTRAIIKDGKKRHEVASQAVIRSGDFSKEIFCQNLEKLL